MKKDLSMMGAIEKNVESPTLRLEVDHIAMILLRH